jgi:hypothetical protein
VLFCYAKLDMLYLFSAENYFGNAYMKKTIKKVCLLLSILVMLNTVGRAQDFFTTQEYGFAVGGTHYFGDLNPNYGLKYIRPVVGVLFKQHMNPYIAISGFLNASQLGYNDAWSNNAFQKERNLHFQTNLIELGATGEFNFFWFETGKKGKRYTPYLTLGLAAFYTDPTAKIDGRTYRLKALGTEGQNTDEYKNRKYSNINLSMPIGVGFKMWLTPGLNLAIELVNRFTTTDYIDDVSQTYVGSQYFGGLGSTSTANRLQDPSTQQYLGVKDQQRGDKISYDQYIMAQIKLTFQLKTYKCPRYNQGLWEP